MATPVRVPGGAHGAGLIASGARNAPRFAGNAEADAPDVRSWQPVQPRVSPGWRLVKLRIVWSAR